MTIKTYTVASFPRDAYSAPRPVLSDYAARLMTLAQAESLSRDMSAATGRTYFAYNVASQ